MILGKVTATVVMTAKHPAFAGEKLLEVTPLDEKEKPAGATLLALDRAQAGVGDTVLVLREGSGIRQILNREHGMTIEDAVKTATPVRSLIVAVVDQVQTAESVVTR